MCIVGWCTDSGHNTSLLCWQQPLVLPWRLVAGCARPMAWCQESYSCLFDVLPKVVARALCRWLDCLQATRAGSELLELVPWFVMWAGTQEGMDSRRSECHGRRNYKYKREPVWQPYCHWQSAVAYWAVCRGLLLGALSTSEHFSALHLASAVAVARCMSLCHVEYSLWEVAGAQWMLLRAETMAERFACVLGC